MPHDCPKVQCAGLARVPVGSVDAADVWVRRVGVPAVRRAAAADRAHRTGDGHRADPAASRAADGSACASAIACAAAVRRRPRRLDRRRRCRSGTREVGRMHRRCARRPSGSPGAHYASCLSRRRGRVGRVGSAIRPDAIGAVASEGRPTVSDKTDSVTPNPLNVSYRPVPGRAARRSNKTATPAITVETTK